MQSRASNQSDPRIVIARARHEAIRRAQALTLSIEPGGRWTVRADLGASAPPLLAGVIDGVNASLRLYISPLGICFADTPAPPDWDAVACDAPSVSTDRRPAPGPPGQ